MRGRIKSILSDLKPDKAIVFTKKGWSLWPDYDDDEGSRFLPIPETEEIEFGTYIGDGFSTVAYGLRHPQFASFETMKRSVAAIMAHDLSHMPEHPVE